MKKKLTYISRAGLMILTCVLTVLFFGIMSLVSKIQGTARVVNYAGLVRGKTQRIIKLEDAGQPQDGMIADIDAFIAGLRYGSDDLDLVRLNDTAFQNKMTDLAGQFEDLKNEIQKVREKGYEQTEIIQKSESFFNTCDEATGLAVPQEHFVGRDGGDEFLALLYGLDHKGVQKSLKMIRTQNAEYSEQHPEMPISYAVGYALSTDFEGSNLRELFRLADKNMYVDKNRAKMEEAAEVQRQNYALLDDIKARSCQFTDCVYCDALLDEYRVLRASTGFFLAEDGSYSGAVEQVVQELSNDENRKELWKSLQLPYLGE